MDNNPISFVDPFGLKATADSPDDKTPGGVEEGGEVSQTSYRVKEIKVSANVVKYKNYKEFKHRREHINRTQNHEKLGTSRKDWKAYLNKTYGTERVNAARKAILAEQNRNSSSWSTSSTMMASLAISIPASGGVSTPVVAAVGITVGVAALGVAVYQSITYDPDEVFDNLPDYVTSDDSETNSPSLPIVGNPDVPYPGQGNKDENWNRHILYEIYATGSNGRETLKYGISDQVSYDEKRPQSQIPKLQAKYGPQGKIVSYVILERNIENRIVAKAKEYALVFVYFTIHGDRPPEQFRPMINH